MKLANLRKYIIGFGVIVIFLVILAFLSVNNLRTSLDVTVELINLQRVVTATNNMEIALLNERVAVGQYALTGTRGQLLKIDEFQREYDQRWTVVSAELEESYPELVEEVESARETYTSLIDSIIAAREATPGDNVAAVIKLGDLDTFSRETFFPLLQDLFEPEETRLNTLINQERARASRLSIVYGVLSALSLVVGVLMIAAIFFAFNITRDIINSVESLIEASDSISRGDLDVPIDVEMGGDMQTLAESIERMRTSLKAAIERLRR